jgi:hypothetical protein
VYLFTWDEYPTDSVFRVNEVTNKVWQFRDRGRGRHPQIWYEHRHKTSVRGSGFNPAIHAFSIDMRKYSPAQQPIAPQVGFCNSKPRQWIRYWTRIKHDDVSGSKASTWVATEDQDPTLIVDETDVAVRGGSIELFNVEFNHSFDDFCGGPIFEDQVYYFRNFAALLNPPADISSLLVKPVP